MTTFLLYLSFLLHIITLTAIYFLFKHIQTLKGHSPEDMHDLLEVYLEEIKKENAALKEQLSQGEEETSPSEGLQVSNELNEHHVDVSESYDVPQPDVNDTYEQSFQAKVLHLYSSGYTVDAIAKELDCGKTEAELVVKMNTNNQA